jgi:CAAX protease family protein
MTSTASRTTPAPALGSSRTGTLWRLLAALEAVLTAGVVARDVLIPAVVLTLLACLSLAVRHEGWSTLGLRRFERPGRLAGTMLGLTLLWTLVQIGLVLPVLEHATGQRQDLGMFDDLRGNLPLLLVLLLASWTLAAFVEEVAFRGYLRTRLTDALGPGRAAGLLAAVLAGAAFGLAHSEQGAVGVGATFLDALFFTVLTIRSRAGLWASILAHGFNNTIGITAYFAFGPVYGLW